MRYIKLSLQLVLLAVTTVSVVGCELGESGEKIQYMPDMADAPFVRTQRGYLDPPENSVPMNAILYPKTVEDAEKYMKNPYPNSAEVLEKGKDLFAINCSSCHGAVGKGDGTISPYFAGLPDITSEVYRERADGFFFYRITFGQGRMPSYGHAISPNERWFIIHHLRTLQK